VSTQSCKTDDNIGCTKMEFNFLPHGFGGFFNISCIGDGVETYEEINFSGR